ncbi:unnamed protein product [Amoebophrya sp. A120]|nr:unnamed protein product [Amoebophrya sp. A120]|eukprot:GSA120T00022303001.1
MSGRRASGRRKLPCVLMSSSSKMLLRSFAIASGGAKIFTSLNLLATAAEQQDRKLKQHQAPPTASRTAPTTSAKSVDVVDQTSGSLFSLLFGTADHVADYEDSLLQMELQKDQTKKNAAARTTPEQGDEDQHQDERKQKLRKLQTITRAGPGALPVEKIEATYMQNLLQCHEYSPVCPASYEPSCYMFAWNSTQQISAGVRAAITKEDINEMLKVGGTNLNCRRNIGVLPVAPGLKEMRRQLYAWALNGTYKCHAQYLKSNLNEDNTPISTSGGMFESIRAIGNVPPFTEIPLYTNTSAHDLNDPTLTTWNAAGSSELDEVSKWYVGGCGTLGSCVGVYKKVMLVYDHTEYFGLKDSSCWTREQAIPVVADHNTPHDLLLKCATSLYHLLAPRSLGAYVKYPFELRDAVLNAQVLFTCGNTYHDPVNDITRSFPSLCPEGGACTVMGGSATHQTPAAFVHVNGICGHQPHATNLPQLLQYEHGGISYGASLASEIWIRTILDIAISHIDPEGYYAVQRAEAIASGNRVYRRESWMDCHTAASYYFATGVSLVLWNVRTSDAHNSKSRMDLRTQDPNLWCLALRYFEFDNQWTSCPSGHASELLKTIQTEVSSNAVKAVDCHTVLNVLGVRQFGPPGDHGIAMGGSQNLTHLNPLYVMNITENNGTAAPCNPESTTENQRSGTNNVNIEFTKPVMPTRLPKQSPHGHCYLYQTRGYSGTFPDKKYEICKPEDKHDARFAIHDQYGDANYYVKGVQYLIGTEGPTAQAKSALLAAEGNVGFYHRVVFDRNATVYPELYFVGCSGPKLRSLCGYYLFSGEFTQGATMFTMSSTVPGDQKAVVYRQIRGSTFIDSLFGERWTIGPDPNTGLQANFLVDQNLANYANNLKAFYGEQTTFVKVHRHTYDLYNPTTGTKLTEQGVFLEVDLLMTGSNSHFVYPDQQMGPFSYNHEVHETRKQKLADVFGVPVAQVSPLDGYKGRLGAGDGNSANGGGKTPVSYYMTSVGLPDSYHGMVKEPMDELTCNQEMRTNVLCPMLCTMTNTSIVNNPNNCTSVCEKECTGVYPGFDMKRGLNSAASMTAMLAHLGKINYKANQDIVRNLLGEEAYTTSVINHGSFDSPYLKRYSEEHFGLFKKIFANEKEASDLLHPYVAKMDKIEDDFLSEKDQEFLEEKYGTKKDHDANKMNKNSIDKNMLKAVKASRQSYMFMKRMKQRLFNPEFTELIETKTIWTKPLDEIDAMDYPDAGDANSQQFYYEEPSSSSVVPLSKVFGTKVTYHVDEKNLDDSEQLVPAEKRSLRNKSVELKSSTKTRKLMTNSKRRQLSHLPLPSANKLRSYDWNVDALHLIEELTLTELTGWTQPEHNANTSTLIYEVNKNRWRLSVGEAESLFEGQLTAGKFTFECTTGSMTDPCLSANLDHWVACDASYMCNMEPEPKWKLPAASEQDMFAKQLAYDMQHEDNNACHLQEPNNKCTTFYKPEYHFIEKALVPPNASPSAKEAAKCNKDTNDQKRRDSQLYPIVTKNENAWMFQIEDCGFPGVDGLYIYDPGKVFYIVKLVNETAVKTWDTPANVDQTESSLHYFSRTNIRAHEAGSHSGYHSGIIPNSNERDSVNGMTRIYEHINGTAMIYYDAVKHQWLILGNMTGQIQPWSRKFGSFESSKISTPPFDLHRNRHDPPTTQISSSGTIVTNQDLKTIGSLGTWTFRPSSKTGAAGGEVLPYHTDSATKNYGFTPMTHERFVLNDLIPGYQYMGEFLQGHPGLPILFSCSSKVGYAALCNSNWRAEHRQTDGLPPPKVKMFLGPPTVEGVDYWHPATQSDTTFPNIFTIELPDHEKICKEVVDEINREIGLPNSHASREDFKHVAFMSCMFNYLPGKYVRTGYPERDQIFGQEDGTTPTWQLVHPGLKVNGLEPWLLQVDPTLVTADTAYVLRPPKMCNATHPNGLTNNHVCSNCENQDAFFCQTDHVRTLCTNSSNWHVATAAGQPGAQLPYGMEDTSSMTMAQMFAAKHPLMSPMGVPKSKPILKEDPDPAYYVYSGIWVEFYGVYVAMNPVSSFGMVDVLMRGNKAMTDRTWYKNVPASAINADGYTINWNQYWTSIYGSTADSMPEPPAPTLSLVEQFGGNVFVKATTDVNPQPTIMVYNQANQLWELRYLFSETDCFHPVSGVLIGRSEAVSSDYQLCLTNKHPSKKLCRCVSRMTKASDPVYICYSPQKEVAPCGSGWQVPAPCDTNAFRTTFGHSCEYAKQSPPRLAKVQGPQVTRGTFVEAAGATTTPPPTTTGLPPTTTENPKVVTTYTNNVAVSMQFDYLQNAEAPAATALRIMNDNAMKSALEKGFAASIGMNETRVTITSVSVPGTATDTTSSDTSTSDAGTTGSTTSSTSNSTRRELFTVDMTIKSRKAVEAIIAKEKEQARAAAAAKTPASRHLQASTKFELQIDYRILITSTDRTTTIGKANCLQLTTEQCNDLLKEAVAAVDTNTLTTQLIMAINLSGSQLAKDLLVRDVLSKPTMTTSMDSFMTQTVDEIFAAKVPVRPVSKMQIAWRVTIVMRFLDCMSELELNASPQLTQALKFSFQTSLDRIANANQYQEVQTQVHCLLCSTIGCGFLTRELEEGKDSANDKAALPLPSQSSMTKSRSLQESQQSRHIHVDVLLVYRSATSAFAASAALESTLTEFAQYLHEDLAVQLPAGIYTVENVESVGPPQLGGGVVGEWTVNSAPSGKFAGVSGSFGSFALVGMMVLWVAVREMLL